METRRQCATRFVLCFVTKLSQFSWASLPCRVGDTRISRGDYCACRPESAQRNRAAESSVIVAADESDGAEQRACQRLGFGRQKLSARARGSDTGRLDGDPAALHVHLEPQPRAA